MSKERDLKLEHCCRALKSLQEVKVELNELKVLDTKPSFLPGIFEILFQFEQWILAYRRGVFSKK